MGLNAGSGGKDEVVVEVRKQKRTRGLQRPDFSLRWKSAVLQLFRALPGDSKSEWNE